MNPELNQVDQWLILPVYGALAVFTAAFGYLSSRERLHTHRSRRQGAKVTIIGDMFCDIIANGVGNMPEWGEDEVIDSPVVLRAGGSGLNTSIWLHNLSNKIQVRSPRTFSRNGSDAFTATLIDSINAAGLKLVPTSTLPCICHEGDDEDSKMICEIENDRLDWKTGTCVCISGPTDRSFITYRGGNGVFKLSDFKFSNLVPLGTQHVHVGGYYNCPGIWGDDFFDFIVNCRRSGVKTLSLNPQYGKGWGGGIEKAIGLVDFFICNATEAMGIAKVSDLVEATMLLAKDFGCNCVVVTMGAEGALLMRRCLELRPVRVLCKDVLDSPITDTVGVGDAFCAGFLHEVVTKNLTAESPDIIEAVRYGCACGTAAMTVLGGSTFPGLASIRGCLID